MYCRNCGKEVDEQAIACPGCGVPPLKGSKRCQACGGEVEPGAAFCPGCGARLMGASAMAAPDDRTMVLLAHILVIFTGWLGPLIIWLIKGKESAVVEAQAKEALNFGITLTIGFIASFILAFVGIGFLLYPILWVCQIVFPILAIVQTNNGNMNYQYPVSLRLVK